MWVASNAGAVMFSLSVRTLKTVLEFTPISTVTGGGVPVESCLMDDRDLGQRIVER